MHHRSLRAFGFIAAVLTAITVLAQEFSIRPDHESGIYQAGETVKWTIELKGEPAAVAAMQSPTYRVKTGGLNVSKEGPLQLTDGKATIEAQSAGPGWLLLDVSAKDTQKQNKDIRAYGGAIFSPDQIKPSAPCPEDFDAFWQAKLEELSKVPAGPKLTEAESGREGVKYYGITMNNIRGTQINGQLAHPAGEGKFPAMLIVQWAGVYTLKKDWVTNRAADGWLVLNIQPHDLPALESDEFFKQQTAGPLKGYPGIGGDDRETSYFLRMYLSCYRAAEYLTTRDDWDGKVLLVTGSSQGGLQSIVTAGLHPKITAATANVPAGCDHTGPDANRAPGWPGWITWSLAGKELEKSKQASRYFDVVNFAARVKCPVLVSAGGIDTTCPPVGVFAMYNQLATPKEMVFMPLAGHGGKFSEQFGVRDSVWTKAAKEGAQLPPKE